jgi:hypothetical protein
MKHITKWFFTQMTVWYLLALLSLVALALLGRPVESEGGWRIDVPRRIVVGRAAVQGQKVCLRGFSQRVSVLWCYVCHSWWRPGLRSGLIGMLWELSGRRGPLLLAAWPWVVWLWQVLTAGWPELRGRPMWSGIGWMLWQGQRLLVLGYLGQVWHQAWLVRETGQGGRPTGGSVLALGYLSCGGEGAWAEVTGQEDGSYQATLCGHFTLRVAGDDPFRARLLMLFLRLLEEPGHTRSSRRTRDGRTPFVRQQQIAEWFAVPQPDVSRVEGYWMRGAWPELLSQCTPEILTAEVVRRIVTVCATFPDWSQEQIYRHLQAQGLAVSQRQVRQAMEQSGWSTLRQELARRYQWTAGQFRLQQEWLLAELLRHLQLLQECLETGQRPVQEEQVALHDLQTVLQETGVEAPPPLKALPWLLRVQQVVWGDWQEVDAIRCPDCGSTHIVRKSRKGRQKKYYDAQGQLQEVTVYRYYCRNPECERGSFTHFPPGLVPYSRHRLEVHLLAWQAYAWGYSTYRRVGQSLQVSEMTVYRWVSAWGTALLPVATLFGVVRSSGIVGVDEKYVLVPKNDKPTTERKRWMYVYLAVDVYTYDLLHIALYPYNTRHSAHAFLLAVRSKGYHPRVVVTDLRRDYAAVIAQVFPKAQHHHCLFHAEQEIGRYLCKTFGRDYAQRQPEAEQVRAAVGDIFRARTKRTAHKRYQALLQQQAAYVEQVPALQWVFEFLEQHWPTLINAVESDLVPITNNAVEMVIRRFDQHYQNFCGFESLQSAQLYLGVFEKVYRFTPFSDDAQPRIRGKSPLQLAGYDLSRVPMTWLCRGFSLDWPLTVAGTDVPNS